MRAFAMVSVMLLFAGCSSSDPQPATPTQATTSATPTHSTTPTVTPTQVPTPTPPTPTATPTPTPTPTPTATPTPTPTTKTVNIQGFAFSPATLSIHAGDSVQFTNQDSATHTATGASFDTGNLGNGASKTIKFSTAGSFSYHCKIHASMTGTINVT